MKETPRNDPYSLKRRLLPLLVCAPLVLLLILFRPRIKSTKAVDDKTQSCLANLNQISKAYAMYALDYDGKFPRGVDPEDRHNPTIWRDSDYGDAFYKDAMRVPYLHEVLRPYVKSSNVFHCPGDVGWSKSRLPEGVTSTLTNVKPSSFRKYGTSYYCLTRYSFALHSAADLDDPTQTLLLFDGDLWHSNAGQELLNGLFADGHAQNLSAAQFEFYTR